MKVLGSVDPVVLFQSCSNVGITEVVVLAGVDISVACSKWGCLEGLFGSTEAFLTLSNSS